MSPDITTAACALPPPQRLPSAEPRPTACARSAPPPPPSSTLSPSKALIHGGWPPRDSALLLQAIHQSGIRSLSSFPEQFWRGSQFLFFRGQWEEWTPHLAPHPGKEENASPSPDPGHPSACPASQCVDSLLADMAGDKGLQSDGRLFSTVRGAGGMGRHLTSTRCVPSA